MAAHRIDLARSGDLAGLNLAGLVRLSFETDDEDQGDDRKPYSGRDIRGRDEQTDDCRTYVERRGGVYVYTYEEPNTSAYKRKRVQLPDGRTVYRVVRPIFEQALADLKRGSTPDGQRLDGLIVYDIDRLTRDPRHLEDAIEVVEHFGKPIIDITGTPDLLTDNGRTMARVLVAAANKASADTARRVRRKHQALQRQGIPAGGPRPFGWQDDRRTLDEAEADLLRDAVRRILGGAPLAGIVADWNRRGIVTSRGNRWIPQSLKDAIRNPRICGYRGRSVQGTDETTGSYFHYVEPVLDREGNPVIGQWQPIISVADWRAVTAVIGERRQLGFGDNTRKYLLSTILRCGVNGCDAKMRATARKLKEGATHYYQCPSVGLGGCGGVSISGPLTDKFISEAVIAKFELGAARRNAVAVPDEWQGEDDLRAVRERIAELTAGWRARPQQVSTARYFALLPELEQEERGLLADQDRWLAERAAAVNAPLTIRADWESGRLTLPEQRAYVQRVLVAVVVAPAEGRKRWNPDRLSPVWRTSASEAIA